MDGTLQQRFRERYNLLVVLGPTASGKTQLSVVLARRIGGEILSADSRQVYIGMDLGTGKDLADYGVGEEAVPRHLIDLLNPCEEYSVFAFQKHFSRVFREVTERGRIPILTGGTGLYLDAVLRRYPMKEVPADQALRSELAGKDLDSLRLRYRNLCPAPHNTTDWLERERIIRAIEIAEFDRAHPGDSEPLPILAPLVLGIRCERGELRRRITDRLRTRLEAGMIEEVADLHARGVGWERIESFGLEYRFIALYLQKRIAREEMHRTLNTRIHQFAKRQETWFRRMEKNGIRIHWIDGADERAALDRIESLTA